jgi:Domain of unknown function (DUF4328)
MSTVQSDESVTVCPKCGNERAAAGPAVRCVHCGEPLPQREAAEARPRQARELGSDGAGLGPDRLFGHLTTALQWIFAAWAVFAVVGIAFRAIERSLLSRAADNRFSVSRAEALASDHRVDTFAYVAIAVVVVTAIVFIVWFHRAYRKTRALGGEMRYSDGWAIGAWFIPIGWFWIPKKLANDIWWGTERPEYRTWRARSAVLTAWWLAWVFAWVLLRFSGTGSLNNLDDARRANLAALTTLGLLLLAAAFALFVVRQIGQRVAARTSAVAALVAGEAPAPATPTKSGVGTDPGLVTSAGPDRQPWRLIGATAAIVALAVGTVVVVAGTSGSPAHTVSKPVNTAPEIVSAPTPADFDRHQSGADGFAISVPNSWTSVDLTAPDIDATLEQLRLTNPDITDYLDQQDADAPLSFYAMDTSGAGQTQMLPAQFSVQRITTEGQSLNEGARQAEEALSATSDLVGSVHREKVELPAGSAQVLSLKFHLATPAGDAIVAKTVYMLASGDSAYVIALGGADDRAQPNASTFEAIIRSLEIKN